MREGKFTEHKLEYDPELKTNALRPEFEAKWPTVYVRSAPFGEHPQYERFRRLALGYLTSGKALATELGENPDRLDWPRASVACFCYYHSVELFLKACILFRNPGEKLTHHDVAELKTRYHELYPVDKFFTFEGLWDLRLRDVEIAFDREPSNYYFDGKNDQLFRYLADKQGNPPTGEVCFAPGVWLGMMEAFEEHMDRIWSNVLEVASGVT